MSSFKWQLIFLTLMLYQSNVKANSTVTKRSLSGFHTNKQFPYQVYIEKFENYEWQSYCAGVIISNRIVLTAASCLPKTIYLIRVKIGSIGPSGIWESAQQMIHVKRSNFRVHPDWDEKNNFHNIALIRIPADIQFNEYIKPAQLPDKSNLYEDQSAVVSVWMDSLLQGNVYTEVVYGNVSVLPGDECRSYVHKYAPALFYPLSWMCLKPSDTNICDKDLGSPLVNWSEDGTMILLGLASHKLDEYNICYANRPAIFTRVSSYLEWIQLHE